MKTKEFVGTCVENPFDEIETLVSVVEQARDVTKRTFLNHCFLSKKELQAMREYPDNFEFHKNKNVYFYTHSAIEHFYL